MDKDLEGRGHEELEATCQGDTCCPSTGCAPRRHLFSEFQLTGVMGSGYKHNSGDTLLVFKSQFWYVFAV